jgi:hypothetical protein
VHPSGHGPYRWPLWSPGGENIPTQGVNSGSRGDRVMVAKMGPTWPIHQSKKCRQLADWWRHYFEIKCRQVSPNCRQVSIPTRGMQNTPGGASRPTRGHKIARSGGKPTQPANNDTGSGDWRIKCRLSPPKRKKIRSGGGEKVATVWRRLYWKKWRQFGDTWRHFIVDKVTYR